MEDTDVTLFLHPFLPEDIKALFVEREKCLERAFHISQQLDAYAARTKQPKEVECSPRKKGKTTPTRSTNSQDVPSYSHQQGNSYPGWGWSAQNPIPPYQQQGGQQQGNGSYGTYGMSTQHDQRASGPKQ